MIEKIYIDAQNYNFSPYEKETGFSGKLILAVNKTNPVDKWIVKHDVISDVFAELLFSNISNDLGFSVPECRLGDYNGWLAVYIRYIENLKRIPHEEYSDKIYRQIFLMNLFGNDDRPEFYLDGNKTIWGLDNSWCFYDDTIIKMVRHKSEIGASAEQLIQNLKQSRLNYINKDFQRAYISIKERKELAKEILEGVSNLDLDKYRAITEIISISTAKEIGELYFDYIREVISISKTELNKTQGK